MTKTVIRFRSTMDFLRKCVVNETRFCCTIKAKFDTVGDTWVVTPGNSEESITIPQDVVDNVLPELLKSLALGDVIEQMISSDTLDAVEKMWGPRCNADGNLEIEFGLIEPVIFKVHSVEYPEFSITFVVDHKVKK